MILLFTDISGHHKPYQDSSLHQWGYRGYIEARLVKANETAFLDRMHCYIPGWEIPKYRPDFFTNEYRFITDYLSEFMREMRKEQFSDISDKYFRFCSNLNQRDVIGVRKMISGFAELLYLNGEYTKEDIFETLTLSLELSPKGIWEIIR